jgi:hypothetical protein
MIKMKTLFKKDPNDLGRVIDEIDPENMWVFDEGVIATRKWDGTACMIKNGVLYKRYDAKKGKTPPLGSIPCQPKPDPITGHWPHWVACRRSDAADIYHCEAFDKFQHWYDGTYELCGPKINGNKEKLTEHILKPHGDVWINLSQINFQYIKNRLEEAEMEGFVFHHPDGRMCKIRRSDWGFEW